MKKQVGLWIDHKQAVIVTLIDKVERTIHITSDIDKNFRGTPTSRVSHDKTSEIRRDRQDNRLDDFLRKYYREVIECFGDADRVLIFGPGEAKSELKKQLESNEYSEHIIEVQTADKMTDAQVIAKVCDYFWS